MFSFKPGTVHQLNYITKTNISEALIICSLFKRDERTFSSLFFGPGFHANRNQTAPRKSGAFKDLTVTVSRFQTGFCQEEFA
jgi:hypothetical protein